MPKVADVHTDDLLQLRDRLQELSVAQIVDELGRLDPHHRALTYRMLSKGRAVAVFEALELPLQRELLGDLREDSILELFAELDPDDRAELVDELPAGVATRLLRGLSPDEQRLTTALLGYPADSAGRRMSPQVVAIRRGATVQQALEQVREGGADAETIYMVAVLGEGRRLDGVVSLRRLFFSEPGLLVDSVMARPVSVLAGDDQETAARVILDNRLVAAPVVDAEQRLLGVLTVDDALRVLEREQEEDVARSGGTLPLRRPYLSVGVFALVRSRIAWLLVLVVAATLTVRVLDHFESVLDEVVTLALFVPLLIGTGGNAGSQAATTVVRAMAVGDVRPGDVLRVVGREVLTGLLLGVALTAVGFLPAVIFAGVDVALVLAITVLAVCTLATTAGSIIPIAARKLGVDPAVVSAPFISTFVDATGLIVYFLVARAVLGL